MPLRIRLFLKSTKKKTCIILEREARFSLIASKHAKACHSNSNVSTQSSYVQLCLHVRVSVVYACVRVCVCVCFCVSLFVYRRVVACLCVCVYVCVFASVRVHACLCVWIAGSASPRAGSASPRVGSASPRSRVGAYLIASAHVCACPHFPEFDRCISEFAYFQHCLKFLRKNGK